MNVERRIKKHIHGKPQKIRITTAPGLEAIAGLELQQWNAAHSAALRVDPAALDVRTERGQLQVQGMPYSLLQYLVPRMRSASDIFLTIDKERCLSPQAFSAWLAKVEWPLYLGPAVRLRAESFKSNVYHEGFIREAVEKALAAIGVSVGQNEDDALLQITIRRDEALVEIGLAGRPLYQRDYKSQLISKAPLKAHVAYGCIAAFFAWSQKREVSRIAIPFAGSGTLGFEAVLFLTGSCPDLWRESYGVKQLPFFKPEAWHHHASTKPQLQTPVDLTFIEKDAQQVAALRENCARFAAPFDDALRITICEDDALTTDCRDVDAVLMNPPYGDRLGLPPRFFANLQRWISDQTFAGLTLVPDKQAIDLSNVFPHTQSLEFQTGGSFTHSWMWSR